jgi:predicted phage tail protein
VEEYVTRREFLEFKKQIEQRTEEIPAINVNVASQDVVTRLDVLEQGQKRLERGQKELKQELKTVSDTWLETLQGHYNDHTVRFEKVESTMATKDDLAKMKEDIIDAIRKYSQPGKN